MSKEQSVEQTMSILDDTLISILQKVIETGEKASEFLIEQTPLVVIEMLNWYFAYYLIMFILSIAVLYTAWFTIFKIGKKIAASFKSEPEWGYVFSTVGGVILIGVSITMINLQWLKIWIAPKLFLIEKLAELTK